MTVYFEHSDRIRAEHPGLVAGVLYAEGVAGPPRAVLPLGDLHSVARDRLVAGTEGTFPEIQAWRRAFSRMGLAPTRYRCAAESLLRRLRTDGGLPSVHPLVDLGNAVSAAYAIPVGILDVDQVTGGIEVRHARGDERYLTFTGVEERPDPGEVIFADGAGRAHARRWTNRQSGWSALREGTSRVLVVVEALHDTAGRDVPRLLDALAGELARGWGTTSRRAMLTAAAPRFEAPPLRTVARRPDRRTDHDVGGLSDLRPPADLTNQRDSRGAR